MVDASQRRLSLLLRTLSASLACVAVGCADSDTPIPASFGDAGIRAPSAGSASGGSSGIPGSTSGTSPTPSSSGSGTSGTDGTGGGTSGGTSGPPDASVDAPSTGPDAGTTTPPCECPLRADECSSTGLTHYTPTGTCDGSGSCIYRVAASICNAPPASTCSGNTQIVYANQGTCAPSGGGVACTYAPTSTACSFGCAPSGDLCSGDPCAGNTCAAGTPLNTCAGLTLTSYGTSTCNGGSCVGHPTVTQCDLGNPCIAYGCSPTGCTSQPKPDFTTSCGSGSFCQASKCVARVVDLAVLPTTATIRAGGTVALSATTASNNPSETLGLDWSESNQALGSLVTASAAAATFTATSGPHPTSASEVVTVRSTVDAQVSATAMITIAPDLVVDGFPLTDGVHAGQLTAVAATVTGLLPTDTGQVTFTVTGGVADVAAANCTISGTTSTCTAIFHAGPAGPVAIHVASADQPSQGDDFVVNVVPPVDIVLSAFSLDLLSFGTPGFPQTLTCALTNLLPDETSECTFTVSSGNSVTVTQTDLTTATVTAAPGPDGAFWFTTAPAPSAITITVPNNPNLRRTIPANVHAWVQDQQGAFSYIVQPTCVAIAPTGAPLLGGMGGPQGATDQPSVISKIPGVGWGELLQSSSATSLGTVSHITVGDGSNYWASGTLTSPTPSNFVVEGGLAVTTLLVQNLALNQSDVNAVGHNVVASDTDVFYGYNEIGATGCNDTTVGSLSRRPAASGNWSPISFGDESSANGNSCPFTAVNNRRFESMTFAGGAFWLGGLADCGTTGCSSPFGFHGLAAYDPNAGVWASWQGAAASQDVRNPRVKTGYDGSILAINGEPASDAFPQSVNMLWMDASGPTQSPAGAHFGPALSNAFDTGDTIGGAAFGVSPWAFNEPDIFFAYTEGVSGHHYVGWQIGSTGHVIDITTTGPNSDQIIDVQFALVNGKVEAWATGMSSPAGGRSFPLVLHLQ
jgi:hypothetical protein